MRVSSFIILVFTLFFVVFEITAGQTSYKGTIKPLLVDGIKYGTNQGYRGMISDIREIGEYVFPEVTNLKGEVIKPASLLVSLDAGYWNSLVEAAKMAVLSTEINMKVAKLNYERAENLVKSKSIAAETRDNAEAAYYQAFNNYINAKATLYQQEKQLDFCKIYSSMCGIVTNRFIDVGEDPGGEPVVMEVTQLSPIGIDVTLTQDSVLGLNSATMINVKNNAGFSFEFNSDLINFDGKTGTFKIPNYMIYGKEINIEGKKYPVVDSFAYVSLFGVNQNDKELALPAKAIQKNGTDEYIWLAEKIKEIKGEYGDSHVLSKIVKVNISTDNELTVRDGNKKIIKLKNDGILKINDIVLTGWNDTPYEGQEIILAKNRYNFMPGESVTLTITY